MNDTVDAMLLKNVMKRNVYLFQLLISYIDFFLLNTFCKTIHIFISKPLFFAIGQSVVLRFQTIARSMLQNVDITTLKVLHTKELYYQINHKNNCLFYCEGQFIAVPTNKIYIQIPPDSYKVLLSHLETRTNFHLKQVQYL